MVLTLFIPPRAPHSLPPRPLECISIHRTAVYSYCTKEGRREGWREGGTLEIWWVTALFFVSVQASKAKKPHTPPIVFSLRTNEMRYSHFSEVLGGPWLPINDIKKGHLKGLVATTWAPVCMWVESAGLGPRSIVGGFVQSSVVTDLWACWLRSKLSAGIFHIVFCCTKCKGANVERRWFI